MADTVTAWQQARWFKTGVGEDGEGNHFVGIRSPAYATGHNKSTGALRMRSDYMYTYRWEMARTGISFGTAMAIAMSWSVNKSILWAIFHGLLSWLYVIYYAIVY